MYYKDSYHERDAMELMRILGFSGPVEEERSYGAICYLVAATGKTRQLKAYFYTDGIDTEGMDHKIRPYSSSEKSLIRLGLHLFNERYGRDQTITDIFYTLDRENIKCAIQALKLRFKVA